MTAPDPHAGPVPDAAWQTDARARARGRVEMFNATRPDGLDGWTISIEQYELLTDSILSTLDRFAGEDGEVALSVLVEEAQRVLAGHPAFPGGRLQNYVRYVKVDLEARRVVERVPRSSPQRVRRRPQSDESSST